MRKIQYYTDNQTLQGKYRYRCNNIDRNKLDKIASKRIKNEIKLKRVTK